MKKYIVLILLLVSIGLVAIWGSVLTNGDDAYSVEQVKHLLHRNPQEWSGRVVHVRGHLVAGHEICIHSQPTCQAIGWIEIMPAPPGRWVLLSPNSSPFGSIAPPAFDGVHGLILTPSSSRLALTYHRVPVFLYGIPLIGPILPYWVGGSVFDVRLLDPRACHHPFAATICPDADLTKVPALA